MNGPLKIEHAITSDLDGQPWPPTGLMDGWHLVRTVDGQSLWRRIRINTALGARRSTGADFLHRGRG
jgi:hypothetical protein